MLRSFLLISLSLTFPSSLCAENWPEFRGPTGQGHSTETGLPVKWSPTENVKWKVDVPGNGWSSPIYWEGKLVLTSAIPLSDEEPLEQNLVTLCYDATTGKQLWETKLFHQEAVSTQRIHRKNSHASPTPITDGKHVWVHFGTQGTACLTMDGKVVWKTKELVYRPQHGNGGSPVLVDGLLVVSCDGSDKQFVVALDQKTGEIRWKKARPPLSRSQKFSFSTPLVIEVDGNKQLISCGTNRVIAYAPGTGEELWQVDYTGYSVIPRPVYAHGLIFISTSYNTPSMLAIRPTGEGNITATHTEWTGKRSVPHTPSMLVIGNELYMVSDRGIATCLDAKSGEVHWTERLGGAFSASPVYADGRIYFQSEQGETTVIAPGKTYQELGKSSLGERTLASYAIADGAIFLRTATQLYRLEK